MSDLKSYVTYLCKHYPHKSDLSKARLTKMMYLADWRCSLNKGHQLSNIHWKFNHYGPYVPDVVDAAKGDPEFKVIETTTPYGNAKEVVSYTGAQEPELDDDERSSLDFVIDKTKALNWDGFIRLVYSTYPVVVSDRHDDLDLGALAQRYKAEQAKLGLTT